MKAVKAVAAAIIAIALLCGCYDYNEANDLVYATALGIDKGTENEYEITLQYARVFEINSGSEGGESEAKIFDTITVDAPTVYSAVSLANHMISKQFVLSHVKLIVLSEEVARAGVADFAEVMMRSDELRPHIFMAVSRDGAKEYLESVKPSIEINPIKYYQLVYDSKYSAYIPKFDNVQLCFYQDSTERDVVLPVAAVVKEPEDGENSDKGTENNDSEFEYKLKNYIAGDFKRESKNPSEIMGMAVFNADKLAGFAGGVETELYNMLLGDFRINYTTFRDNITGKAVSVKLEQAQLPKLYVHTDADKPTADIRIYLEGEFLGLPNEYIHEQDIESFERDIKTYIQNAAMKFAERMKNEYNSDVLGLGTVAKRNFLTYQEFEEYNWKEKYKNLEFNIDVDFKIRRTGQVLRK